VVMSKREKRELREQEIVGESIRLFSQQGFLGVRMSDIAKQSGYSMGTIYSHFESKEDLLVACAHALTEDHQRMFRMVREEPIPAMEQIISLVQGVWLVATRFPDLVEIENLSRMPSVWQRATEQRVSRYDHLHQELAEWIRNMALEALPESIDEYAELDQADQLEIADYLTHGLWGLSVGLSSIAQSGYAESQCQGKEGGEVEVMRFFSTNYINFLKGYGWNSDAPEQVFERCNRVSQRLLSQTTWYAPQRIGEER